MLPIQVINIKESLILGKHDYLFVDAWECRKAPPGPGKIAGMKPYPALFSVVVGSFFQSGDPHRKSELALKRSPR